MRNLSFKLSNHICPVLKVIFPDSKISSGLVINRHKAKQIIENVLLGAIEEDIQKNLNKVNFFFVL